MQFRFLGLILGGAITRHDAGYSVRAPLVAYHPRHSLTWRWVVDFHRYSDGSGCPNRLFGWSYMPGCQTQLAVHLFCLGHVLIMRQQREPRRRHAWILPALASILLAIAAPAHAADGGMSKADWINLLAPAIGAVILALAGLLAALLTGLSGKISAYFAAHNNAAAAAIVAQANAAIDRELETSASVIAGKIDAGTLDYTDRAAWQKEAVSEVALIQARLPAMALAAASTGTPLLTQLMAKVDDKAVASPTINAPAPLAKAA